VSESQRRLHIVAFGAHAGDVENACALTLAKYVSLGHRATIVHVTLGEAGHPNMSRDAYAEQRKREVRGSAEVLGCEVRWLPYRDGELVASPQVELAFCDLIRELRPDVMLTHWRGSLHRDHVLTHHLTVYGAMLAGLASVERELPPHRVGSIYFAENWEDPQGFVPEVYLDVSDVFGTWLEAAGRHALFRGEVSKFPYQEYYRALARVRGAESGCQYAVALMRHRPVEKRATQVLP